MIQNATQPQEHRYYRTLLTMTAGAVTHEHGPPPFGHVFARYRTFRVRTSHFQADVGGIAFARRLSTTTVQSFVAIGLVSCAFERRLEVYCHGGDYAAPLWDSGTLFLSITVVRAARLCAIRHVLVYMDSHFAIVIDYGGILLPLDDLSRISSVSPCSVIWVNVYQYWNHTPGATLV